MSFIDDLNNRIMTFDGSMGVMLQRNGLEKGVCPEEWNLTHPQVVKGIYKAYVEAGSDIIQTNTFQSNGMKLEEYGLKDKHHEINAQSVRLAKEVSGGKCRVAASIGPLGKLLEPFGELTFQQAYNTFKDQVTAVAEGGADIISFETFTDMAELRIALLAAKENCGLPVICSISYEKNGKTLMGSEPEICAIILHSMGADLIGTNCSFGAEYMVGITERYAQTGLPFSVKPNAGLPRIIDGKPVFDETPESFAKYVPDFIRNGARLIGGCCGTTPEYIAQVAEIVKRSDGAGRILDVNYITSTARKIAFEELKSTETGIIDINNDEALKKGILSGNSGAVADLAMSLLDEECDVVIIDADVDGHNDEQLLARIVEEAQTYMKQPFVLKSRNANALGAALRVYKGRAGILTGSWEDAAEIARKYGAADVGGFLSI